MRIHKEGYQIIAVVVLMVLIITGIVNYFHPQQSVFHYLSYLVMLSLLLFVLRFFRNPQRPLAVDNKVIISPADGKVVEIMETNEPEYFNDTRLKVSIFMSPNNVHKNWYPTSGKVKFYKHHPGKFLVAWHPKSSDLNERTTIVIEKDPATHILLRQIAGAVAQRIKCYAVENLEVKQGEELGFIKFGSRVDIYLPKGTQVMVNKNDKVKGCTTVIARI